MSISKVLAKSISNYGDRNSIGARCRARRLAPLLSMIEEVHRQKGSVRMIDIGGTKFYWNIVPREFLATHNVTITLVNLPASGTPEDDGPFTFMTGDACNLAEVDDQAFDIAHSNSVVEHVGDWDRMWRFSREVARVAPRYFVQTPNFWFPMEPHCMTPFFHWLPKPTRVWLVAHFQLGNWRKAASVDDAVRVVESARLLNRPMMRALFEDAEVLTERLFLLPKSFVAVKNPRA